MHHRALSPVALAVLAFASPCVFAQDACGPLLAKGAPLVGAGGKNESMKSGKNTICQAYSADRSAKFQVILETNSNPAQTMATFGMLAKNSKEPGMKVADEPSVGPGAYSLQTKEKVDFQFAGKGLIYNLSFSRDGSLAAGELDRVRAVAKQIAEGR